MTQLPPHQPLYAPAQPTNSLAIAGFICSLIGLFTAVLSPVGLVLSLIALGKPFGRGWAIAGLVLGLVGTCGWVFLVIAAGSVVLALLAMIGIVLTAIALSEPEKREVTYDMARIHHAVKDSEDRTGFLPASLSSLSLSTDVLTDPWGNAYRYVLDTNEPGFDIISDGKDGKAGTEDDVRFSRLNQLWRSSKFDVTIEGGDDGGSVVIDLGDSSVTIQGDAKASPDASEPDVEAPAASGEDQKPDDAAKP